MDGRAARAGPPRSLPADFPGAKSRGPRLRRAPAGRKRSCPANNLTRGRCRREKSSRRPFPRVLARAAQELAAARIRRKAEPGVPFTPARGSRSGPGAPRSPLCTGTCFLGGSSASARRPANSEWRKAARNLALSLLAIRYSLFATRHFSLFAVAQKPHCAGDDGRTSGARPEAQATGEARCEACGWSWRPWRSWR